MRACFLFVGACILVDYLTLADAILERSYVRLLFKGVQRAVRLVDAADAIQFPGKLSDKFC